VHLATCYRVICVARDRPTRRAAKNVEAVLTLHNAMLARGYQPPWLVTAVGILIGLMYTRCRDMAARRTSVHV